MRKIVICFGIFLLVLSCKKNNPEKAFLRGQLLSECGGTPVANTTVYFYQNFVKSTNWLMSDTEEELLETATTDEEGYFYFWGDDYTNKNTATIYSSSVRLNHETFLITGDLGKGKGYESSAGAVIQDVGTIFKEGAKLNFDLTFDTLYDASIIDSIVINSFSSELYSISLTDKSSGKFRYSFNGGNYPMPLEYDLQDVDRQFTHKFNFDYRIYSGGTQIDYVNTVANFAKCQTGETITSTFDHFVSEPVNFFNHSNPRLIGLFFGYNYKYISQ